MANEKSRNPQVTAWAVEWIQVLRQRIGEGGQDCGGGNGDDDEFCLGKLFVVLAVRPLSNDVSMAVI